MSSTDSLRRTERGAVRGIGERTITTVIASLLLTVVLVSFRPFQPAGALDGPSSPPLEGGDIVNQVGFFSLGLIAIFSLAAYVDRRRLVALASPWWLMMFGFVALSVVNAVDPPASLRSAIFVLMAIICIAAVLTLPRDADAFSTVLAVAGFVVIGLSYVGLVLFPDEAKHTIYSTEPEHAGLWRGVFSHKNIAGPVMACFSFAGLYLCRRGWTWAGIFLFVGAMIFMANTGSKTTLGLVPLAILIVMWPGLIGMRGLSALLVSMATLGTAAATLGIVFIGPLKALADALVPGINYTGRTTLWEFAGEMIAKRPWTGYGLQNIWGTPIVTELDQFFDQDWDFRTIPHGHDGYLDIALMMGLPAMAAAAVTFLVVPVRDYLRVPLYKENVYLGDFFMMVALFTSLNAFLETFFFNRADPVWLFFVFGVLGLRMTARFPVHTRSP
jgi:O-antigen ligase